MAKKSARAEPDPPTPKITENEVLQVHSVEFGGGPDTKADFFCRQTYLSEQRQWITFTNDHLCCLHHTDALPKDKYRVGETCGWVPF